MTAPLVVLKACSIATLDQVPQDGLLLDLDERFEEWLRFMENVTYSPSSDISPSKIVYPQIFIWNLLRARD